MLFNPDTGVAVLTPPRTASRSVALYLEQIGFEQVGDRHQWAGIEKAHRAYVVIRNHFDALVSWWSYLDEGDDFNQWWNTRFLTGSSGACALVDTDAGMWTPWIEHATHFSGPYPEMHTIRFETLAADLHQAFGKYNAGGRAILPRVLDVVNLRAGRHYSEVMSYETRHAIERIFGVEMKRLGYYWQPTSPSRCR